MPKFQLRKKKQFVCPEVPKVYWCPIINVKYPASKIYTVIVKFKVTENDCISSFAGM